VYTLKIRSSNNFEIFVSSGALSNERKAEFFYNRKENEETTKNTCHFTGAATRQLFQKTYGWNFARFGEGQTVEL